MQVNPKSPHTLKHRSVHTKTQLSEQGPPSMIGVKGRETQTCPKLAGREAGDGLGGLMCGGGMLVQLLPETSTR